MFSAALVEARNLSRRDSIEVRDRWKQHGVTATVGAGSHVYGM